MATASRVFGYNPDPRFSVNHLTEYMSADHASQRDKVILEAKFPRRKPVTAYQTAKREIRRFFVSGRGDVRFFDTARAQLEHVIRTDEEARADARRDLKAIEHFIDLYSRRRWNKVRLGPTELDVPITIEGVHVNVRLDVALTERDDLGVDYSGGIVMFTAQTDDARKNVEQRRKQVAQLVLWSLEGMRNMQPLPRLCMSMDIFGGELTKASESADRFRGYVRSACREVCLKWDQVEPPAGYDGPALRMRTV